MLLTGEQLREKLLKALKIENESPEVQDMLIIKLENLAFARVGNALDEMLTAEQKQHIDQMRKDGVSEEKIVDWIQSSIPQFGELMQAVMLDLADELNKF